MMSSVTLNHRRHDDGLQLSAAYSPKPQEGWTIRPVDYLFQEQRFKFILIGMAIATAFFILQPGSLSPEHRGEHGTDSLSTETHFEKRGHRSRMKSPTIAGGKIHLGLKAKRLRIVVTAGFVGSHLVDRLMERGDNVIVIDNFFTGRKENLERHFGDPRFELIRHDVVEPILLEVDQIIPSLVLPLLFTTSTTPSRLSYPLAHVSSPVF